jgi:hypothetical protein
MRVILLAAMLSWSLAAPARAADPITLDSLLKEMADRSAISRYPDPAYTCKQFSSYDRASTTPDDPKTWFANGDYNQFLRIETVAASDGGATHKEWVMADMDGPGAVVRIWSANPKGNLKIYLDGSATPALEAPMAAALGGKWKVSKPLSEEVSRGWNLYLPIPYAKHCKVTCDSDGFYYQVNYRTYVPTANVVSFTIAALDAAKNQVDGMKDALGLVPSGRTDFDFGVSGQGTPIGPEGTASVPLDEGSRRVVALTVQVRARDLQTALRSLIVIGTFDGEPTIWCPLGDFIGSGVGANTVNTFYQRCSPASKMGDDEACQMTCAWVMPYEKDGKILLHNLGQQKVALHVGLTTEPAEWTTNSMHFHATWHAEYPIHAYGGRGTRDWNYLEAQGKGVYVGDSLAVMNPVAEWWGEGDEKIYVDGEKFPSHFGTGTEDYYGYAWGSNVPFQHPFHAQPRCDGQKPGNSWGHTTVGRVRALDAIPFTTSFKFDMEIWHWRECDEAYAVATYWYARPGATTNRKAQPEDAVKPIPQPPPLPPPYKIELAGATTVECESMKVLAQTPGITVVEQDMKSFGQRRWSGESHLWFQGSKIGDFCELEIPVAAAGPEGKKPLQVTLFATKSWDYGIIKFSVNGRAAGEAIDLFSGERGKAIPSGPIELGAFEPANGKLVLRAEVVGANEHSEGTRSFFGLDCVVLKPVAAK